VLTLQTPFSVCLPPPLNILLLFDHFIANMWKQFDLNKKNIQKPGGGQMLPAEPAGTIPLIVPPSEF
jgi:hypothetical protein